MPEDGAVRDTNVMAEWRPWRFFNGAVLRGFLPAKSIPTIAQPSASECVTLLSPSPINANFKPSSSPLCSVIVVLHCTVCSASNQASSGRSVGWLVGRLVGWLVVKRV